MEAIEFFLCEGVLNDNILRFAPKPYAFKGKYIAEVVEYRFKNAWSNSKHIKRFRSKERLIRFLEKNYPHAVDYIEYAEVCRDAQTKIN